MNKRTFFLVHKTAREGACQCIWEAPEGYKVTVQPPPRNLDQNAAQWVVLQAFAEQLKWPVNGELVYMQAEDWKHVLTAAFRQEAVRVAKGIDGGTVMLGMRTREMDKKTFSEYLDFLHSVAADRGVTI